MLANARTLAIAFLLGTLGWICYPAEDLHAQGWANKLFSETQHDFGSVSRNAKAEHAFVIENCFEEDVHIASVRSSCGCTTPILTQNTLKSWEKAEVIARFNTGTFVGTKSAIITVVIDRPYYAEVQLSVGGTIRSDVMVDPGEIKFGDVEIGQTKTSELKIQFFGRKGLEIVDVQGNAELFEVRLEPPAYQPDSVSYRMRVSLKDTVPVSQVLDEILIITNAPNEKDRQFSIPVTAKVRPQLTVTPEKTPMGDVRPGEFRQYKLIVKSRKPFSIDMIQCDDERFEFQKPQGEKQAHFIPFSFRGSERKVGGQDDAASPESIRQAIKIITSQGEEVEALVTGRLLR